MSTVTIRYSLSAAAVRRIAVETGELPPADQVLGIDLAALTPEQRALVLDARDGAAIKLQVLQPVSYAKDDPRPWYVESWQADAVLSAEGVLAHLASMDAQRREARDEQARLRAEANAKIISQATAYLATPETDYQAGSLDRATVWPDAPGADEAAALVEQAKAKYARALALNSERQEREKAEAEAKRAAEHAAKLAWAQEHGSDQLRRGLEAGHTCTRLYWGERAEIEYPNCELDFDKRHNPKSRACPSLLSLNARDALLAAHPGITAEIVWLAEPDDWNDDPSDYDGEWKEREAIQVDDPAYGHYLYYHL